MSDRKGSIHEPPSLLRAPTRTKQFVLRCTLLASRATLSVFPNPGPDILFFPMIFPFPLNLAMIIMGGLFIQVVVLALWMVKTFAGLGVISQSPRGPN